MTHYTTLVQRCRSTNSLLADELDAEFRRLERVIEGERDARWKLDAALRMKDDAVNTLMERLHVKHGDTCEDLIP